MRCVVNGMADGCQLGGDGGNSGVIPSPRYQLLAGSRLVQYCGQAPVAHPTVRADGQMATSIPNIGSTVPVVRVRVKVWADSQTERPILSIANKLPAVKIKQLWSIGS